MSAKNPDDYWRGKIKVVGTDNMCWPVDPITLSALACSFYDPWCWDKCGTQIETISVHEWYHRREVADRGPKKKG